MLGVAGIAAFVMECGETGVTARLETAMIDGLLYASSMVTLYAARHLLPDPRLARRLLALGIVATLAANIGPGLVPRGCPGLACGSRAFGVAACAEREPGRR